MLSRGVASLCSLSDFIASEGRSVALWEYFMPFVAWIGDRASSVAEKSIPLFDVTCLSVVSGS